MKANVGELEEEVREGFTWHPRKELNGVAEAVYGKKR